MKFALSLLTFTALSHSSLIACTCGPHPPVRDALTQASVVFVGQCIAGKLIISAKGGMWLCQFTFKVTRSWKGATDMKEITVETGLGRGDCGYNFNVGSDYIVYCNGSQGVLQTDICTRTCEIDTDEMRGLDEASQQLKLPQ